MHRLLYDLCKLRVARPGQSAYVMLVWLVGGGIITIMILVVIKIGHGQPVADVRDHAGLVVQFGDGRVVTDCVKIQDRGWSTAEELLHDSLWDVDIVTVPGAGDGVCQIEYEGCNTDASEGDTHDCFCACQSAGSCNRWRYYQVEAGIWQRSLTYNSIVAPGDVVGWVWGDEARTITQIIPFAQLCVVATATPTPTETPTTTPTSTAPPTTTPTSTAPPSTTPTPSENPTTTPTFTATPTGEPTVTQSPTSTPILSSPSTATAANTRTPTGITTHTRSPTRVPTVMMTSTILATPEARVQQRTTRPTSTARASRTVTPVSMTTLAELAPPSSLLPTSTPAPTVMPLPTHTLVPTNTPLPTVPPAPTLEPLPTVTPSVLATPTIDETAMMAAILATEYALLPTSPASPTVDQVVAIPLLEQTAQNLRQQGQAGMRPSPPTPTTGGLAGLATVQPADVRMASRKQIDTAANRAVAGQGKGSLLPCLLSAAVVIFIALVIAMHRLQHDAEREL